MSMIFSYPTTDEIDAVKALSKDARDALALQINSTPPERLFNIAPDGKPICPVCGNGSGVDGTGVDFTEKATGFLYGCRRPNDAGGQCHFNGFLVNVAAKELGIDVRGNFDGFCTVLAAAAKFAGVAVVSGALSQSRFQREPNQKTATTVDKPPKDYSKLYAFAASNLPTFVNRLGGKWRGLPLQFLKKVGAGFTPKNAEYEAGVIFPYTANHYFKRLVNDDGFCISDKGKHPKQHHGKKLTFYRIEDVRADTVTFVTEGEVDALSVKYVSDDKFTAIATGGADGWHDQIANLVEVYGAAAVKPKFAVLFDNDAAGDNGAKGFVEALAAAGFVAKSYHLREAAEKYDANDWLQDNPDALRERLNELHALATTELTVIAEQMAIRADSVVEERAGTDSSDTAADSGSYNVNDTAPAELAFIKNAASRNDFIKLRSQPDSPARNAAMVQIIRDNLDWRKNLKGEKTTVKATAQNYRSIFYCDPTLSGLYGTDEFTQQPVFLRQAPWRKRKCVGTPWDDNDDAQLRLYLREHYGELAHGELTSDFFRAAAMDNAFHSVQRWVTGLPAWDGTPRAESLFIKFLGVEDSAYAREVSLNWLMGALARIFYSGCNYHYCLLLCGAQGIGKSYLLEQLGGNWYIDLKDRVDDPKAVDAIQAGWVCELGELSASRKADVNALKNFLSESYDCHRFPYERHAVRRPRHVVFAGTCNDAQPLNDQTGARRFLILKCNNQRGQFVTGLDKEYVRQTWAEVYHKFRQLFPTDDSFDSNRLLLSPESAKIAAQLAEGATGDDGLEAEVAAFLDRPIPAPAIWKLMTRAERRDFFVRGMFVIEECELKGRQSARRRPNEAKALDETLASATFGGTAVIQKERRGGNNGIPETIWYKFFGSVSREHISAAEVYTELFGNGGDKRKSMRRVSEVLGLLDGWKKGGRIQGDPQYGDQRNVYYRTVGDAPTPSGNSNTGGDNTGGVDTGSGTGDNTGGVDTGSGTGGDTSVIETDEFDDYDPQRDAFTGADCDCVEAHLLQCKYYRYRMKQTATPADAAFYRKWSEYHRSKLEGSQETPKVASLKLAGC